MAIASGDRADIKYGLHMDMTYYGSSDYWKPMADKADALDAAVSRNSFLWHKIEPVKGQRDWSVVDGVLKELEGKGIEPLFTIVGSPQWLTGANPSEEESEFYVPTDPAKFKAWVAEYQDFVEAAIDRYGSRVKKWELWNEQNEHYFWKPQPNIDQYLTWYKTMYDTIKAAQPDAEVAMGGLAGLHASGPGNINGETFLQTMYDRGVEPDIVNIHPYALQNQAPDATLQWENNFTDIQRIHDLMVRNGQGDKPMWVTEWGWPSDRIGEAKQAEYVAKSLEMIEKQYPFVKVATHFMMQDATEYKQGLYAADGRMKAAGSAFRDFAPDPEHWTPPSSAPVQSPTAPDAPTDGSDDGGGDDGTDGGTDGGQDGGGARTEISVKMAGDAYKGVPHYEIYADGKLVRSGDVTWAKAAPINPADPSVWQDVKVTLDGQTAPDKVAVKFTNDLYAGTSTTDRNLFVDSVTVNGKVFQAEGSLASYRGGPGTEKLVGNGSLTVNTSSAPDTAPAQAASSQVTVKLAGDAYQGAPHYEIYADGKKVGSGDVSWAKTGPANLEDGSVWRDVTVRLDGQAAPDKVWVEFTNDLYHGTETTDRNLYVDHIIVNGQTIESEGSLAHYRTGPGTEAMMSYGPLSFDTTSVPDYMHNQDMYDLA